MARSNICGQTNVEACFTGFGAEDNYPRLPSQVPNKAKVEVPDAWLKAR